MRIQNKKITTFLLSTLLTVSILTPTTKLHAKSLNDEVKSFTKEKIKKDETSMLKDMFYATAGGVAGIVSLTSLSGALTGVLILLEPFIHGQNHKAGSLKFNLSLIKMAGPTFVVTGVISLYCFYKAFIQ